MSAQQTHNVVIVGGNFGGVNLAHYLLQQSFPALKKLDPTTSHRVTLVTPNDHFFFKIASPRALINPTLIPDDKIFRSISEAFKDYDKETFTFLQGKATCVRPEDKSITIASASDPQREIKYDSLVIATGTTSTSPLWTLHDNHEQSRTTLKALHSTLPKASTVLIAGAGPVGVETAGEIASAYPDAKITLITPGERVLPRVKPSISAEAKQALEDLGVTLRLNTGLAEVTADIDIRPIQLSDGSSKNPDVFINATGPRTMNTAWLPSDWLDSESRVRTSDPYFRVKGNTKTKGVYVIGDVVSGTNKTAIEIDAMVPTVASSIAADIAQGKVQSTGGLMAWLNPFGKASNLVQREYKPMKDTIIVPIGPSGGVGQVFGWGMPSFMVRKGKAESFLMELVEPLVTGKKWV
ncbi:FAD/NAD(P)-binding domain-containing protein [Trematosphaeria pertusa]|uniref:FAD/NAD(P)-binding domain-containing protein n=1 Tax=Trematosphaeria pertusa TaxID=390896 RepID=A0A6A6I643_9PLEO|nr:FAD/NAD(P)-binding domain-containing protein [Trematosphaeria pertusa]KAF2245412.1 FAD/NAD(P)-binding domain-containing protein [Trematosphaeria pertusa]